MTCSGSIPPSDLPHAVFTQDRVELPNQALGVREREGPGWLDLDDVVIGAVGAEQYTQVLHSLDRVGRDLRRWRLLLAVRDELDS